MRKVLAICGDSGSGKSTMATVLSSYLNNSTIVECDRYHKWERYDTHWKEFTHLNPYANHISLMTKDLKSLKQGNDIFRRDYDHTTGKFTEDRKIESSENIILCGLHTFYCDTELYNLKIYMDTEEDLKIQWKIARDTSKRGYSMKRIKQQIATRKYDYQKFLHPFAEDADIIVNFCTEETTSYLDSVKGIGRSLKIFIRKPFDISTVIEKFKEMGVDIEVENLTSIHSYRIPGAPKSSREDYLQITIKNYKPINTNYYYDYIMVCVLQFLKEN